MSGHGLAAALTARQCLNDGGELLSARNANPAAAKRCIGQSRPCTQWLRFWTLGDMLTFRVRDCGIVVVPTTIS